VLEVTDTFDDGVRAEMERLLGGPAENKADAVVEVGAGYLDCAFGREVIARC